jgi:hypothetical protein
MISRLLLPSAVRLATYSCVRRSRLIRARPHPSQTDHVQRAVGLPVATSVEAMAHYLSRGGFHGRHSAETREGGLTPQPLGIVFKATLSSVAAWSVPMPNRETNSGAASKTSKTSKTSRSSCTSS